MAFVEILFVYLLLFYDLFDILEESYKLIHFMHMLFFPIKYLFIYICNNYVLNIWVSFVRILELSDVCEHLH